VLLAKDPETCGGNRWRHPRLFIHTSHPMRPGAQFSILFSMCVKFDSLTLLFCFFAAERRRTWSRPCSKRFTASCSNISRHRKVRRAPSSEWWLTHGSEFCKGAADFRDAEPPSGPLPVRHRREQRFEEMVFSLICRLCPSSSQTLCRKQKHRSASVYGPLPVARGSGLPAAARRCCPAADQNHSGLCVSSIHIVFTRGAPSPSKFL
jgi:hypothetical protein